MEIKINCEDDGVIVATTIIVDNLETEESLQKVFVSFVKFLEKCGAEFPEEILEIAKDYK